MSKNVLCVYGNRSFKVSQLKPKMQGVVDCWRRMGYIVQHVCGGDIFGDENTIKQACSETEYYQKWYRKLKIMAPAERSVSEYRDIKHDALMESYLSNLVKQNRPDIIWERSSRLHAAGLKVARKNNVPYILEWKDHLIPYSFSLFRKKALLLEEHKNKQADYIVVESGKLKNDLAKTGLDPNKILIAVNAVDTNMFHVDHDGAKEFRKEIGVDETDVLVGYVGSYAFYHDTPRLILAASILKQEQVANFKILLVGSGKEYEQTCRLACETGLFNKSVIMKPAVNKNQVPRILSALDVAVLPGSTDIICPIKVQEYMALGLPSVVPDYPANREVITDGRTGMLFEPKNEQELADKLKLLIRDKELRKSIGNKANQEVSRRFTWEKTWGKALNDIFDRIGH